MFDKSELERYRSFTLCDSDDGLFLFAIDKELRRSFILSTDSSRSKLVAIPKRRSRPESNSLVTLDKAFEILSKFQLLSE